MTIFEPQKIFDFSTIKCKKCDQCTIGFHQNTPDKTYVIYCWNISCEDTKQIKTSFTNYRDVYDFMKYNWQKYFNKINPL
jgi:hypothetical protein